MNAYNDQLPQKLPTKLAIMSNAHGNVPALQACIDDARAAGADQLIFLGNATGYCGHSAEILQLVAKEFDVRIVGHNERELLISSTYCGCGYDGTLEERLACLAKQYSTLSFDEASREEIAAWPSKVTLETVDGTMLLGAALPGSEIPAVDVQGSSVSGLSDQVFGRWLESQSVAIYCYSQRDISSFVELNNNRVVVNCGAISRSQGGDSLDSSDTAASYVLVDVTARPQAELRSVNYDHAAWAKQLRFEGVDDVFVDWVEPINKPKPVVKKRSFANWWRKAA